MLLPNSFQKLSLSSSLGCFCHSFIDKIFLLFDCLTKHSFAKWQILSLFSVHFLLAFLDFFPEYSEAVPGLPTSYAAILRIKSGSSSLASFNSKNRPRLSSPSLGSVSSPGWRGAAQHYYSPTNLYHFSETFKHDGKCSFPL